MSLTRHEEEDDGADGVEEEATRAEGGVEEESTRPAAACLLAETAILASSRRTPAPLPRGATVEDDVSQDKTHSETTEFVADKEEQPRYVPMVQGVSRG